MKKSSLLKRPLKYIDTHMLGNRVSTFLHRNQQDEELFHLNLDITSSCNLQCRTCSLRQWQPKLPEKRVSEEILAALMPVFAMVRSVDLQCNCEPLLHPDIVGIVRQIKRINPSAFVAFVTNGMLLNSKLIHQLVESGVDKIGFSIDGASTATYEYIRTGAHFEHVLTNIRELIAFRDATGSLTPKIEWISVASQLNLAELPDILRMGIAMGISAYSVNGLEPYTEEMVAQIVYAETVSPQAQEVFQQLREEAQQHGIQLLLPSLIIQPYTSCQLQSCVIDASGAVFPCPALSYQRPYYYLGELLEHPQVTFGNLHTQQFFNIWKSTSYASFRRQLRHGKFPEFCQRCLMMNRVLCPTV